MCRQRVATAMWPYSWGMATPTAVLRDGFRTKLWPIPTLAVLLALVLSVALPQLDQHLGDGGSDLIFGGGADAARTVLSAIAGSLITVTSLTFSLTVVTLQLASSQFSPRLLRTFTRDLLVQGTLGLFLGTFVFALSVLRTVRTETGGEAAFIPRLSVTFAFVLAVASVVALVLFLGHLTQTIRVESMLKSVHQGASSAVSRLAGGTRIAPEEARSLVPSDAALLIASSSGFLVDVHDGELVDLAVKHDVVVFVGRDPGDSVVAGTPMGHIWRRSGSPLKGQELEELMASVNSHLTLGFERTSTSDTALGLRQLTDVAVKALSPGINDPTTAVHAISHSSALLCQMSHTPLGARVLNDEADATRVVLSGPVFADLLSMGVEQPALYGREDAAVLGRLLMLLREVAWSGGPDVIDPVRAQLDRLRRLVRAAELDPHDAAKLEAEADRVVAAADGRWET